MIRYKSSRIDGRTLSHPQSEYIRQQAVKMVRVDNQSPEEVIKIFGLHRSSIYRWLDKYDNGGANSLLSTKANGPAAKLSAKQKYQIARILLKNPTQLRFEYALWTIEMIVKLIEHKFGVSYSGIHVGRLLNEIGYSKQKPLQRAYEQDPQKVKRWLKKEYPAIKKEAKYEKRSIYFGDEAGFHSTAIYGGTWAPKGQTPVIATTGQRIKINCISAINNKGSLRFMLYERNFNSGRFIEFLKRLMHKQTRPVTLIIDGHNTHKTKTVKEFVEDTQGKLKLYYLPPYSPELNPDELVWNNAKQKVSKQIYKPFFNKISFQQKVKNTMIGIQRDKELITSFYHEPNVSYAM